MRAPLAVAGPTQGSNTHLPVLQLRPPGRVKEASVTSGSELPVAQQLGAVAHQLQCLFAYQGRLGVFRGWSTPMSFSCSQRCRPGRS